MIKMKCRNTGDPVKYRKSGQCSICLGEGKGVKNPLVPLNPQVVLTPPKNCQNKSKIHC